MTRVLEAKGARAQPMLPRPYRVRSRRMETRDTCTLELSPEGPSRAFLFEPGQFNMLFLPGVGEVPVSISSFASRPGGVVHTVRAVGPVSSGLFRLEPKEPLGLRGPFGRGWPLGGAQGGDVAVIAGGIGLAPLRPAVQAILERRERFGRVFLLYGARSPGELLYRKELGLWRSRLDLEVGVTVDRSERGWRGRVGVVTTLLQGAALDPSRTTVFLCGPEVMLRFAAQELEHLSLDPSRVFVSMERNMKCAVGFCGHCQYGPDFICKDGPVLPYARVRDRLALREL